MSTSFPERRRKGERWSPVYEPGPISRFFAGAFRVLCYVLWWW